MQAQILNWQYLGLVPYREAFAQQIATRDKLIVSEINPRLLLLEHPPVVTMGRRGSLTDLRVPEDELSSRGVDLVRSDRGGLLTYHGPGQLVGYPIVDLSRLGLGVHDYVQRLSQALQTVLAHHGVDAQWSEDRPGLWVGNSKIASFGVHVHHNVTTHGFALNVQPELAAFDLIVACGHASADVTSVAALRGELCSMEDIAREIAAAVSDSLGMNPVHEPSRW